MRDGVSKFLEQHPDVTFACFNTPVFPQENLTQNERFIVTNAVGRATILNNINNPAFAINRYYDTDGIVEVLNAPRSYHDINGVRRFEDTHGKCVNTAGGHRITAHQPHQYRQTVFILGGCRIFGVGAADEHTIASFLQELFNERLPEQSVIVQNYGFYLAEMGDAQTGEELAILESLPVKPGDVILWNFQDISETPYIDISNAAMQPRPYEVFFDTQHYTPDGNRLIAEKLFTELITKNLLALPDTAAKQPEQNIYGFDSSNSRKLTEYKKILVNYYEEMFFVKMGAIVMNCNPFTLGHRYLIEQALTQCDYLAVFIVQEDKSIFPFEDRIHLVDVCTSDLKNIVVIPSGSFIISSLTFSEYFNKSEMQERVVDSSLDVTIFAREIAPCLHITKRFAGEEPFDTVTNRYNETMKRILPEYGIEFVEIPRKKSGEDVISASRVRTLLENKDFENIRPLVPDPVFQYLMEWNRFR
ncbi:MAG: adenylyltransferase/cytidyltransferase family protein [Lachnospiraceae bacterium]|nr:adenylyltransferase/cytidyltransferase family protein [Lachnospiraceae bacterium]